MDLALLDGVAQRAHDVLLADDVGERAGAVTAVEEGPVDTVVESRCPLGRAPGQWTDGPRHVKKGPCTLLEARYPGRCHRLHGSGPALPQRLEEPLKAASFRT